MTILSHIRNAKEKFREEAVRITEGYDFNQHDTIKQVELYFNSRYLTGEFDDDGFKKPFFNIVRKPCLVASKEIDLDTKDIIVRSQNGDYLAADIMSLELKQWMREEGFAKKLNEYADLAPIYGSVVVKKVGEELHTVDLKNLTIEDPTAKSLDHTGVIESHQVTPDELRQMASKGGWDMAKVEEVIDLYAQKGKPLITIDERYGWVKSEMLGEDPGKLVYTLSIVGGAEEIEDSADKSTTVEMGIEIFHAPIDKHPYREWHWMKMPNRWLGVGLVEISFDAQIRRNETAYLKSKALLWSSLQLFQTDDENIAGGNLLTEAQNGDILKLQPNKAISPVNTAERNLAHYNAEEIVWERNVQDLTFSSDIIGGESLPSGTPARSAILQDQNVKRFFDRKREDFGLFIKDIIEKDILPIFMKKKRKAHILSIAGGPDDRDRIEQMVLDTRTVAAFQRYVKKNKVLPSLNEWQRLVNDEARRVSQAKTLDIELPDGFYENLDHRLEVVITKENEDTDSKIAGRRAVLEVLGANPAIATNPATRPVFMELAHLLGVKNLRIPTNAGQPEPAGPQGAIPQGPETNDVLQAVPV